MSHGMFHRYSHGGTIYPIWNVPVANSFRVVRVAPHDNDYGILNDPRDVLYVPKGVPWNFLLRRSIVYWGIDYYITMPYHVAKHSTEICHDVRNISTRT